MRQSGTITVPIIVVLSAIAYIYYTTVFVFIDDWFGLMSSPGLLNAGTFTLTAIMCLITYAIAIVRDPGGVPATFMPDVEDSETPIHEIKRKGGDLRYCQKCSHYKPPRAHHCRVCKRCVLRMDHHCIWINNCVGHANYKIFFDFVLYALTACFHSLILLVGGVLHDGEKDEQHNEDSLRTYYIISGVLLIPLAMALSIFLGWHVYLTLQNKTTIEYHEGVRAMWLAEKVGNVYRHPYNLGPFQNLTTIHRRLYISVVHLSIPPPQRQNVGQVYASATTEVNQEDSNEFGLDQSTSFRFDGARAEHFHLDLPNYKTYWFRPTVSNSLR